MTHNTSVTNHIIPFILNESDIRGRVGKFGSAIDQVLNFYSYPEEVAKQLAELLVITSLIGSLLKDNQIVTVQIKSSGAVPLMIAEYYHQGKIRGYARWNAGDKLESFDQLFKDGILAVNIDNGPGTSPYQGMVDLTGGSITTSVEHYFFQSEQIVTSFKIAIGKSLDSGTSAWLAGGIMLQMLPSNVADKDLWVRNNMFLHTTEVSELIDPMISSETLLFRLFHEDGVLVYTANNIVAACRCSRQRLEETLQSFPKDELEQLKVDGKIEVTCEFCNKSEVF